MTRDRYVKITPEIRQRILDELAGGSSLSKICSAEDMPGNPAVYSLLKKDIEFQQAYILAREVQAELFLDEIIEIADDGRNDTYINKDGEEMTDHDVIARSRLRVDTRKWAMARLSPKKYGDKVTQEVTGPDGGPLQVAKMTLADFYGGLGAESSESNDESEG